MYINFELLILVKGYVDPELFIGGF